MKVSNIDEELLNSYHIKENANLNDYSMSPILPGSLMIKNGVQYIVGAVSSGKSTLISKMIATYTKVLNPIIVSFYGGLSVDETTMYNLSTFKIKPIYVKLPTPESMVSFFTQFRYKRIKLAELLMFLLSVFKDKVPLLLEAVQLVEELNIKDKSVSDSNKRMKALLLYVTELISAKKLAISPAKDFIYLSEFITKQYSRKHKVSFSGDPALFICHCLLSFSKGFKSYTVTVDILNETVPKKNAKLPSNLLSRFTPYNFPPFLRVVGNGAKIELVPSISIFDDIAGFPLFTTEHAGQFVKDLLAETRRWMNSFIFAGQRHNLLNKSLRALTHTFYIGYGLVDSDIPIISKEMPSNLMAGKDFQEIYHNVIGPFTFLVYNNKLGVNIIKLKK